MEAGASEVKVHDGMVLVHDNCVEGVEKYMKPVTAYPSGYFLDGVDWSKRR